MKDVPKPVKKVSIKIDKRNEYLEKWKDLFLLLDPQVEVTLYQEEGFPNIIYRLHTNDVTQWDNIESVRILVYLPLGKSPYQFLIGCTYDEMYSNLSIDEDIDYCRNEEVEGLEPQNKGKSWQEYYYEIHESIEKVNTTEIQKPPN